MKCSVRAAGVKEDDTHSAGVRSTGRKISAEKAGRAHSSWRATETILTLTVLLVRVGVADTQYVNRLRSR